MDIENILGALARGYCSEGQTHKVMDPELCEAQAQEIMALFPSEAEERPDVDHDPYSKFQKELEGLINLHSLEGRTDMPDFLLAAFVVDQLRALESLHRSYMHWSSPKERKPLPAPLAQIKGG